MKLYEDHPITGWHVLVTILAAILIASLLANFGFIQIVDTQQYRIEKLEYRLYELNLKETRACFTQMLSENKTCDVPNTTDYILCPQLHKCDMIFFENSQHYKDW
jgi:hypothetical protein